jgi:hypothetical protein
MRTSRTDAGVGKEATSAGTRTRRARRQRTSGDVALARAKSRTKGGIREMAKKTAKGGKKKGGKKR